VLVLTSAATLLFGIVRDDGAPIALSLAAATAALILLWAGVARSSGPSDRDRHG
jgi:hypothetical protein